MTEFLNERNEFFMKHKINREDIVIYALILLGVILFWIPFFGKGLPDGYELGFHYTRVATLADSLKLGIFPAKLRPMHMKMYGYGVGFFYPDFFIYPAAFLIVLGMDIELAIKLTFFAIIVIGAFVTYNCFFAATGNKYIALIGELLFMGSRINYDNFVVGSGLPHLCAYLFIPLAILGLLEALKGEKKGYFKYALGITAVLLSHHLIFMTMMFVLLIIVVIHLGVIVKNPKRLGILFLVSVVAMAFTTGYWLPAFEQANHIKFIALYDNSYDLSEHIMSFPDLFMVHIGPFLFVLFIIAAATYVIYALKSKKADLATCSILAVTTLIVIITCSRSLWLGPVGQALSFFQYTQRFVFVLTDLMIISIVLVLGQVSDKLVGGLTMGNNRSSRIVMVVVAALCMIITRCDNKLDFYDPDAYSKLVLTPEIYAEEYQVSGAEWLPVECEPSECKEPNYSRSTEGTGADGVKHDSGKYYEVWVDAAREYYDVPYVYYYGYRAYFVDDNMNPTRELQVGEALDDNGYVRVYMPEDAEGIEHVIVTYRKTTLQKISYLVSLVVFASIVVWQIVGAFRRGK